MGRNTEETFSHLVLTFLVALFFVTLAILA